ncbi:MAG: Phage integrase family protein [Parcubacteria bacterium 34_609]|nr:MAG: Phage integrase family protein [Parcubacteria bacterium 34_609]
MFVYSAGLRVGEVVKLKPGNMDGKRILIHVKSSKGRKDRYTLLSEKALNVLRQYWTEYKPQKWLFEGTKSERHIAVRTVQKIFEHACKIAVVR